MYDSIPSFPTKGHPDDWTPTQKKTGRKFRNAHKMMIKLIASRPNFMGQTVKPDAISGSPNKCGAYLKGNWPPQKWIPN